MVSFRFHLVSLTAVFLALALGVTVGATVLERTTVETLEAQVDRVEQRLDRTDRENEALQAQVEQQSSFIAQVTAALVSGRLDGVPIVFFDVEGVDPDAVEQIRATLSASGAEVRATVRFLAKLSLEGDDARELAQILGTEATRSDVVRDELARVLAERLREGTAVDLLTKLEDAGFVEHEIPEPGTPPDPSAPAPEPRFLVMSSEGAAIPSEELVVPFVHALVSSVGTLVLAVEPMPPTEADTAASSFVMQLRRDDSVAGRLSTVDNVATELGEAAMVLALEDLGSGRIGHYGVGEVVSGLLPPPA